MAYGDVAAGRAAAWAVCAVTWRADEVRVVERALWVVWNAAPRSPRGGFGLGVQAQWGLQRGRRALEHAGVQLLGPSMV
jgi:hypothetical protein